ncbi:hypothetical protein ACQPUY_15845 [Clostridium nigeriense]
MFKESIMKIGIFKSIEKEKYIHKDLDLLYVIKGEAFLWGESNEYIMKKDDVLLILYAQKFLNSTSL